MVPVNTVPACTVVAVVRERLCGLFTRIARMSERPQLPDERAVEAVAELPDDRVTGLEQVFELQ